MKKADRLKKAKTPPRNEKYGDRLPPGQTLTKKFPILHEGEVPEYDMNTWSLRVFGEVEDEKTFSYDDLMKMPQTTIVRDIHCVTRWSKFDNTFTGVKFSDFLKALNIKDNVKHVMVYGDQDYESNIPLEDLLHDDILIAHSYENEPLTPQHGYPFRLIVPHLYFWKSVKWITAIEFLEEDRPGFWERNDFHNYGDPYKEERFSTDDGYMPEDEWLKKDFD
ncbi:sulfite oxidase-like oxidoreductase [Saliterribacillus persicus]|uniref:DMSO/TMAO reductase YedYZ molybdopterin-dependent catalytic subunit n=1 Tax=Saliterribacillus persicus TaxID=930114 RepID=A0A368XVC3_9BACI|nr:sulfite oxidase-like oxidoreductase [Saliterribacillus persicus]RCW71921.1 DMSO/TMAO reductase YedYZ molybdopterin-dependent catalytic subunit [Saliterribacillus persicus]